VNNIIYETSETKNKKEKLIIEIHSQLDNLNKTLINLTEYMKEFHSNQRENLENKDKMVRDIKERYNSYNKSLNEVVEVLKAYYVRTKQVEKEVKLFFINF
jgi:hypothetical protein